MHSREQRGNNLIVSVKCPTNAKAVTILVVFLYVRPHRPLNLETLTAMKFVVMSQYPLLHARLERPDATSILARKQPSTHTAHVHRRHQQQLGFVLLYQGFCILPTPLLAVPIAPHCIALHRNEVCTTMLETHTQG